MALTRLEGVEVSQRWPHTAGDTDWVVFASGPDGGREDDSTSRAVSLASGETRLLHRGGGYPRLTGGGLLFVRNGTIFAADIDGTPQLTKEPRPILEGVLGSDVGAGDAQFDCVAGALVYRRVDERVGLAHLVLGFDPGAPAVTSR